jgi:hypothetical protein
MDRDPLPDLVKKLGLLKINLLPKKNTLIRNFLSNLTLYNLQYHI